MGYSPWDHKKSDVTEYACKNALIKIELCVGKITEIKRHCNSEDNSWIKRHCNSEENSWIKRHCNSEDNSFMPPLPSARSAHQNTHFSLFLFSVLLIVSSMSKNNIICCSFESCLLV